MAKSRGFKTVIIIVICIAGALLTYLIWASNHYADHVPPGTKLAGEDVGGYTLAEAKEAGQKIYDSIVMDLTLVNDSSVASAPAITKTMTAGDLGIAFDADGTARAVMDSAKSGWFITKVNPFAKKNVGLSVAVNDEAIVKVLQEDFKDAVFKSKLPKIKYNKKKKKFAAKPGVVGTVIDTDRFLTEMKAGDFKAGEAEYDIHLNSLEPKISDEAADSARDIAEKAVKTAVGFVKDGSVAYKAPRSSKASWVTFTADEEGGKYDVGINTKKVAKFLKTTASENLVVEPLPQLVVREIDMESAEKEASQTSDAGSDGDVSATKVKASAKAQADSSDEKGTKGADDDAVDSTTTENKKAVKSPAPKQARVVREGEEGLAIANRDELANQIKDSMLAFKNIKLTPKYETIPFETEEIGSDFGKWIETNLSQQMTYLWDGNKKIKSYVVSTGKDVTPTLTGTFHVYMKRDHHDMKDFDKIKKKKYVQPDVRYILYFYEAYAYHAAYWHNAFGTQASHGCINMKTPEAEFLYGWAPVGTTCIIHY